MKKVPHKHSGDPVLKGVTSFIRLWID